jgi:hypothetical protein
MAPSHNSIRGIGRMVDKNDSLLREVEDELRRERLAKLWDTYGIFIVGLVAVLVASVGGYQLWQGRQQTLALEGGALYDNAQQLAIDGKADEASRAFAALAEGGHRGYASLANLQLAGADVKAGKTDEALAKFDKIANDSTADPLLKSFATLQAASLRLGTADLPEMQNRLNALAADGNPWRFNARELLGLAAYKAGDIVAATKEFDRILSEQGAPQGVAQRVRVLMGSIMAETLAKVPKPGAQVQPEAKPEAKGQAGTAGAPAPAAAEAVKADTKGDTAAPANTGSTAPAPNPGAK